MSVFGIFAILLGLLAFPLAMVHRTRLRVTVFVLSYIVHVGAGFVFYNYSLTNLSDSTSYYYDFLGFKDHPFAVGTQFIFELVAFFRSLFGGTFLDYFLFFQALGFFGIAILMRIIEEIYAELDLEQPLYTYLLFFLPGMQFWTSAIGKDGIIFAGICLSLWAAMNLRTRYIWAGLGALITMLIRPHIAVILVAALILSMFLDRRSNFLTKLFVVAAAIGGLALAIINTRSAFALDVTNADSVSDFLARHENFTQTSTDVGNTAVQGNLAVKAFSLLFRPMFIDADGAFGLIASVENVVIVIIVGTLLFRFRDTLALIRGMAFVRFALVMAFGTALLLSMVYYNVGLGLRQKWMFMPSILIVFILLMAVRKARHSHQNAEVQPLPAPVATPARALPARPGSGELPASPFVPR